MPPKKAPNPYEDARRKQHPVTFVPPPPIKKVAKKK
jgi:hypothetical protein